MSFNINQCTKYKRVINKEYNKKQVTNLLIF